MTGKFITLESTEGAGKGTAKGFLKDCVEASGHEPIMTREPGGTPFAERIRELLLSPTDEPISDTAELLLLFAAREQHLKGVITPHYNKGRVIICERWVDSTYAYQHFARGLPRELIDGLVALLSPRTPELSFLLDIDPVIGMTRVAARGVLDRIEQEQMDFFHKARAGYLSRVSEDTTGRWRVIDASQPLPNVRKQFITHLVTAGIMTPEAVAWVKGKYDVED